MGSRMSRIQRNSTNKNKVSMKKHVRSVLKIVLLLWLSILSSKAMGKISSMRNSLLRILSRFINRKPN